MVFRKTWTNNDQNLASRQCLLNFASESKCDDLWPYTSLRRPEQQSTSKAQVLKLDPFSWASHKHFLSSAYQHTPYPPATICTWTMLFYLCAYLGSHTFYHSPAASRTHLQADRVSFIQGIHLCAGDFPKKWRYCNLVQ